MVSQKAKELRALALSLSLVNDDLTNKRYLRKSEFYKESDKYKMERQARKLAALNLAKELSSKTPTISAALVNAVNNAPPEIVGHAGDGEIKEGDIKTVGTLPEVMKTADSLSQAGILEALKNLQKTPTDRVEPIPLDTPAIRQRKAITSELLDRKIKKVSENLNNAVDLSPEMLKKASKKQLTRLMNLYTGDDEPTSADAVTTINQHLDIIEDRLKKMEKQAEAEAELKRRTAKVATKPTKPKLVKSVTPGKVKVDIKELEETPKKRGRPPSKAVAERKQMEKEDINVLNPPTKRGPGRPPGVKNKPRPKVAPVNLELEKMLKQREELLKPPAEIPRIIVGTAAEAAGPSTTLEGDGLKDYMNYMKGRKPTKKMKKLIMLIGSQRAGNNSYKLKVEIDKLMADIRQDLTSKISKHKAKSARKQSAEIAKQKRMMQIRQQAKQQMEYEKSLKQY